jgi:hypothetical protein
LHAELPFEAPVETQKWMWWVYWLLRHTSGADYMVYVGLFEAGDNYGVCVRLRSSKRDVKHWYESCGVHGLGKTAADLAFMTIVSVYQCEGGDEDVT